MTDQEAFEILFKYTGQEDAKKLEQDLDDIKQKADTLKTSTDEVKKSTVNMGRSMLESGRIVQDFAQGGIPGILNNIEGLTLALGLGSGLAGVLTIVGVGIAFLGPKIKEWAESLGSGEEKTKDWGTALQQLDRDLAATKKELEEYTKKQALTNDEVERANELSAKQVELEEKKTAEAKKQADIKKLMALKPEGVEEAEKERAKQLQAAIGGQQGAVIAGVAAGLPQMEVQGGLARRAALQQRLEEQQRIERTTGSAEELKAARSRQKTIQAELAVVEQELTQALAGLQRRAADLVAGAVERGEAGPAERLRQMMAARPGAFPAGIGRRIRAAEIAPEFKKGEEELNKEIAEHARDRAAAAREAAAGEAEIEQERRHRIAEADRRNRAGMANLRRGAHAQEQARKAEEAALDPERLQREADAFLRKQKREQQEAQAANLAGQIQARAQRMGGQLTPEQARSAADEMIKLMQQQVPKDVAMMMAINSVVRTMAGLAQRWGQMIGMANGAQRAADGIRQQMEAVGPQMGAQNVGFP
jgi:hypothetical protein